jgi:hypothetical protein
LLHMTLTGFALKSTSTRNRLQRSRQVLKPVRARQLSCKLQLLCSLHQIIFSFVLGTWCYSEWHWLHLERNQQVGWAA